MPESPAPNIRVTVTRLFPVSPEVLYNAWLDPVALGRWLFATPTGVMQKVTVDPRVGGEFLVAEQRGEMLAEHFGTYLELEPARRIVFAFTTDRTQPPSRVEVDIAPHAVGSQLTITHEMAPQWADFVDRARAGWTMISDSLFRTLTSDRELLITRTINAPLALAYKAFVEPQHVAQWWGPDGFTNTIYEMSVRPGGVWRYMMHGPDGTDYPNKVEFYEVVPAERLVYLHGDDGQNQQEPFFVILTFEDVAGQTKLTLRCILASSAEREAVMKFGAVEGGEQTLRHWDEYVASHRQALSE